MRNALIVLAVVALALVFVGAFNTGATVDLDYVVGTWSGVSVAWLMLALAALVLVAGLIGAALARAAGAAERRKLEKELEATYRRLRDVEAALPARPTVVTIPAVTAAGGEAPTAVAPATEAPTAATEAAEAPTQVAEATEAGTAPVPAPEVEEEPTVATPLSAADDAVPPPPAADAAEDPDTAGPPV